MAFSSLNLTQIPSGLTQFSALNNLDLSVNNITSIPFNAVTLSSKVESLNISYNQITSIDPNTLPGILLLHNNLIFDDI